MEKALDCAGGPGAPVFEQAPVHAMDMRYSSILAVEPGEAHPLPALVADAFDGWRDGLQRRGYSWLEGVTNEQWYEFFDIKIPRPSVDDPEWLTTIGVLLMRASYPAGTTKPSASSVCG